MLGGRCSHSSASLRGLGRADGPGSFRRAWTLYERNKSEPSEGTTQCPLSSLPKTLHAQGQVARLVITRDGGTLSWRAALSLPRLRKLGGEHVGMAGGHHDEGPMHQC